MNIKPLVPGDDYAQGQMMGMLVMIQMFENAIDDKQPIPKSTTDKIKSIAVRSLSEFLQKPEEDVILLVDKQLRTI